MSRGHVYILTNPHMPGLVKIGKTTGEPELRAAQLYQTGVPGPFEVAHSVFAPDCHALEAEVHSMMSELRVSTAREFFAADVGLAMSFLDGAHKEQVHEWVDEFLPDHSVVCNDLRVDEGDIGILAYRMGEHPNIIADAMGELTEDEIEPAVRRVYERMRKISTAAAAEDSF